MIFENTKLDGMGVGMGHGKEKELGMICKI